MTQKVDLTSFDSKISMPWNQSKIKNAKFRQDIQGLRGLSIVAVILFHMWERTFSNGYLGVDVFFIISGYLMTSILSNRHLNKSTCLDFYFRRLKRILPLYLSVILVVLLASTILIHPFEYAQLIAETFPSIFYFSNHPAVHAHSYFDMHTSNYFLIHTWSLCVELQFYLLVPFLFFALNVLNKIHYTFSYSLVVYIQILSYYRQTWGYTGLDARHMMPDARIWQFLAGFLAFRVQNFRFWDKFSYILNSIPQNWRFFNSAIGLVQIWTSCALTFTLFIDIGVEDPQLMRLLIVALTTLLLSIPQTHKQSPLLIFTPLVFLGDCSYSLYLIHWPLFIYHRYLNPHIYDMAAVSGKEVNVKLGLSLVTIACLIGFGVEELFKRLQKYIRSWISLLSTIFSLYFFIGILIVYLGQTMMWPFDTSPVTQEWTRKAEREIITLWETRNDNLQITQEESLHLNREIARYNSAVVPCGRNITAPTSFPITYEENTYICRDKGKGHKNIVVVGNSHALFSHTGIRYHFNDLYSNLTLYVATACMLAPPEQQIPMAKELCKSYIEEVVPALRKWNHKIDIIMVFFGYARFQDRPIEGNLTHDPMFQFMQDFHKNLTEIAQDVVFVSNVSLNFHDDQTRELQKRLQYRKPVNRLGSTVKAQLEYLPQIRKRMNKLQCEKCIWIDFLKLWCPDGEFCLSVNPQNSVAYFADYHHVSSYGSMFLGKYMRDLYEDFNRTSFNQL